MPRTQNVGGDHTQGDGQLNGDREPEAQIARLLYLLVCRFMNQELIFAGSVSEDFVAGYNQAYADLAQWIKEAYDLD